MPSLNWIGKEKIVNHDKEVPFRLLKKNQKFSLGKSENLIVEGDNLEALKALMPFYYGKVKCIYIDPPYNTGNEGWAYNDKVNAPKIKEWLGKVVGPEGEDLTRHDKWLCMMYPRLKLLRDLLREDGVIFISIDDNELANLRLLLDDIFDKKFVAHLVWKKKGGASNTEKEIGTITEHVLCYKKENTKFNRQILADDDYPFKDEFGFYKRVKPFKTNRGEYERKTMLYGVKCPDGSVFYPPKGVRWVIGESTFRDNLNQGLIEFVKENGNWMVYKKNYAPTTEEGERNTLFLNLLLEQGSNKSARKLLNEQIFSNEYKRGVISFETPKPVELIKHLIKMISEKDDFILDSFAGSGTTAHAVLDLNKEDGGNRKFILVELEKDIAKKITAERVKRVAGGYSYKKPNGKTEKVEGLGGGFEYVELGDPLFGSDGSINEKINFNELASYVYFTETHTNLEKKNIKGNYLGEYNEIHYYLLFNGIGKNILDRKSLKELKNKGDRKVVYADKCLLGDDILEKYNIVFKQIPYQIKVY